MDRFSFLRLLWSQGIFGRWLAGCYAAAGLYVFIRDDFWRPKDADKWLVVNLIPNMPLAWWLFGAALIVVVWLFEASLRVHRRSQAEIENRSPSASLKLIFDPSDERCIKFISSRYSEDPVGERFFLLVHNGSGKTISSVSVRALPGWFTSTAISIAQTGHTTSQNVTVVIKEIGALDPDATDVIEVFGTTYEPEHHNPDDVLNRVQTFTLEGRARDTKTVSITLQYNRDSRPMLKVST